MHSVCHVIYGFPLYKICLFLPEFFHYNTFESISSCSIEYLHYCKVIISLQHLTMKLRVKRILAGRMEGSENIAPKNSQKKKPRKKPIKIVINIMYYKNF